MLIFYHDVNIITVNLLVFIVYMYFFPTLDSLTPKLSTYESKNYFTSVSVFSYG